MKSKQRAPDTQRPSRPGLAGRGTLRSAVESALEVFRAEGIGEAVALLRRRYARKRSPSLANVLHGLASALSAANPADALTVCTATLEVDQSHSGALLLAAVLHDRLGDQPSALRCCEKIIVAADASDRQVIAAANLLVRLEDAPRAHEAAAAAYERAGRPIELCAAMLYIAQRGADFALSDQLTAQLAASYAKGDFAVPAETPRLNVLWCADLATNIRLAQMWSERDLRVPQGVKPPIPQPLDGRKIKVGYLSSDFREHPTSRLVNGLFRHHDRSRFELFMYCSGWDDGSAMRKEVESHFDHVFSVAQLSDADAANLVRQHGIDVLVELNGPTRAHRMGILAHRPAPVQIDYLGWPGSVGGRVVDYVVGDEYTIPEGTEKLYPERVIRLGKTYQINDHASYERPVIPSRKSLNLPEDRLVIGMFNAINKVNGEVWQAWMSILRHVPNAVLWLLNPGEVARKRLAAATRAAGIPLERVVAAPFASQTQHLARLGVCDLILDPWPYGGHTSTTDALFAGVPVIAMEGSNFAGRVSGGLLRAAGLDVLVRKDADDYVRFASALLNNPSELSKARRWVREKSPCSALFDARSRTRQFEAAYTEAVRLRAEGKRLPNINTVPPAVTAPAPGAVEASALPVATTTVAPVAMRSGCRYLQNIYKTEIDALGHLLGWDLSEWQ